MFLSKNRVALYARYSSENQRSESISAQVRAMEEYCKQHNYIIVERYVDEAKTATNDKRNSFQKMIADSSNKTFDIVLVHKLDRFARNRYDSAIYKRELRKNGVMVYSVLENLNDSPESVILESLLEGMNEYYSKNLGRESLKGLKENAYQCKHTGGKPPLGYDIDKETKRLVINTQEAETVRIIFDLYSKGYGYSYILEELHNRELRTKKGLPFQKNSLYSILTNPKYQGTYVFNRSSAKCYSGTRNTHSYKDEEDIIAIDGGCPQIVTKETYEKVQKRITDNKNSGGRYTAKENYLLSGKVFCADCGKAMVGNKRYCGRNKALYVTYRCPSKRYACSNKEINRGYLDTYLIKLVEENILNKSSLKKIVRNILKRAQTGSDPRIERAIKRDLEEVNIALKNVADLVATGLVSEALIEKINELEQEKASLESKLATLTCVDKTPYIDAGYILSQYEEIRYTPSAPSYKDFIGSLIDKIVVGKYRVEVTLRTGLDIFNDLDTTLSIRRQDIYEYRKTA